MVDRWHRDRRVRGVLAYPREQNFFACQPCSVADRRRIGIGGATAIVIEISDNNNSNSKRIVLIVIAIAIAPPQRRNR